MTRKGVWNLQQVRDKYLQSLWAQSYTLMIWGNNASGALGLNAPEDARQSSPVQVPGTTWYRVTGGSSHSHIATKTDGTLWAFGNNYAGTLGQNNLTQYSSPVQIPGTTWVITGNGEYSNVAFKS